MLISKSVISVSKAYQQWWEPNQQPLTQNRHFLLNQVHCTVSVTNSVFDVNKRQNSPSTKLLLLAAKQTLPQEFLFFHFLGVSTGWFFKTSYFWHFHSTRHEPERHLGTISDQPYWVWLHNKLEVAMEPLTSDAVILKHCVCHSSSTVVVA